MRVMQLWSMLTFFGWWVGVEDRVSLCRPLLALNLLEFRLASNL
jgi:hypothetical protein